MKKIIYIMLLCSICSCINNESIEKKFDRIKYKDFSEFNNTRILYRKNTYFMQYKKVEYTIRKSILGNRLSIEERKSLNNKGYSSLSAEDMDIIGNMIKKFDSFGFQSLAVDEYGNTYIAFIWGANCTYYFLKLSPESTLESIDKKYYKVYEDNWYYNKVCSEQ